jgi:dTMP kinase
MTQGRFIAFEGIDGSGLTTQAGMLRDWFRRERKNCLLTKEPSQGPVGALIIQILRKHANGPQQEIDLDHYFALLFAADRLYHLSTLILPALRSGTHVITDRYYLSSLAYQGLTVDFDSLAAMNARCRAADLTVYLHVPVDACMQRIGEERRWHPDLYDQSDNLDRVQENFLVMAQRLARRGHRIEIVDGDESPEAVHACVLRAVRNLLAPGPTAEVGSHRLRPDVIRTHV